MQRQIIAVGGGAMIRPSKSAYSLFDYTLAQVASSIPKVALLHQASAEDPRYSNLFYEACVRAHAQPTVLSLFGRVDRDRLETEILNQDVIFVGGGNTKSMLGLWKVWGVDQYLRQAYEQGCVMTGVSAGGICWFEQGLTDSETQLGVIEGLGLIPGSMCSHFDSEVERRPVLLDLFKRGVLSDGFALDDLTAIHFIDERLYRSLSSQSGQVVHRIDRKGVTPLPTQMITSGDLTKPT